MQPYNQLIEKASYLSPDKMAKVKDAYVFTAKAHEGQFDGSGTPNLGVFKTSNPFYLRRGLAKGN